MDIVQVREYALSIPDVTEDQPFGDDCITFRIAGKIFLCLCFGGDPNVMRDARPRFALKLTPDRNEELRERYSSITPAWHWNKKHWSDVYFEQLDDTLVKTLIEESFALVAPKKNLTKGTSLGHSGR